MKEQKEIHISSLIKEKMEERGLSVSDFAHALHYERTNIYKIFKRSSIDVDLLLRISGGVFSGRTPAIFNHYRSGQGRYRGDP